VQECRVPYTLAGNIKPSPFITDSFVPHLQVRRTGSQHFGAHLPLLAQPTAGWGSPSSSKLQTDSQAVLCVPDVWQTYRHGKHTDRGGFCVLVISTRPLGLWVIHNGSCHQLQIFCRPVALQPAPQPLLKPHYNYSNIAAHPTLASPVTPTPTCGVQIPGTWCH
jgi:hypothetical protein